jgi:rhodanese-related sulfurtransferase
MHSVSTEEVRARLIGRHEIALLDVRDETDFAAAHPLFAASVALGRLELEILDRVPRATTPVVVYDDGEGFAGRAIQRLGELGYSDVACLHGGLSGWRAAGAELFRDVNVPSKAFGELVEACRHTPSLTAEDLRSKLDRAADLVILDARRFEEYRTMSIPTATSVPGAELVYRVRELAPRPETLVVVNCAGRTRSIIGTQSLVNAGVPNRVVALRNGTIGWLLAGLILEHGQSRRFPDVSVPNQTVAAAAALAVANRAGVGRVSSNTVQSWVADESRTLYRFDVRTPEEFAAGHLSLFRSAPGGQLVQETDVFAPVRGARIVLVDKDGVRANMTGSWLAQMGWDVHVWDEAFETAELEIGEWQPRIPSATTLTAPVANAYKRPYEGTANPRETMQAYLEWEFGLVAQLKRDGTHHFRVI